jgi:hypothetical protein
MSLPLRERAAADALRDRLCGVRFLTILRANFAAPSASESESESDSKTDTGITVCCVSGVVGREAPDGVCGGAMLSTGDGVILGVEGTSVAEIDCRSCDWVLWCV